MPDSIDATRRAARKYSAGFERSAPVLTEARDLSPVGLSGLNNPDVPLYQALVNVSEGITIGGGPGASGLAELPPITLNTSPRILAVYRGIQIIAGTLGNLPLKLYDQRGSSKERVFPDDARTLWRKPNPEMSRITFRKTSFAHNAIGGNTFWYLVKNGLGQIAEIWPIHPDRVQIGRDPQTRRKVYQVDGEVPMMDWDGVDGEMVHIPNLSLDGLRGCNPIQFARLTLQRARATEEYGARVFANGAAPMGVLETEADMEDAAADRLARRWEKNHRGVSNAHRIAVLDNGAHYKQVSLSPADTQLIESESFSVQQIARLLGIPPHLLADSSKSTSWGTGLEEQTRAMVVFTFGDYTGRFEEAYEDILNKPGRYARHDYRALLRGSTLQRYQSYQMGILSGWLSRNEVREFEDLDAGPDELNQFLAPLNMAAVGGLDAVSQSRMDDLAAAIDEIKASIAA